MANVRSYRDGGNLIFWDTHRHRIVDAIGVGVEARINLADAIQLTDPQGWVSTVVEIGAGTTELSGSATAGIIGRITNAGNEDDGGSYQALGQVFVCVASMKWYFGMRFTASDATQSDLFFGLAATDTALLGGVTDGCYFECLDGGTGISVVNEKDSSETQTDSLGTMSTSAQIWEAFWDGDSVHFYIDGVEVRDEAAGENDDEPMRLSIEWLNGAAAVKTLDIHWCRAFAWT